MKKINFVLLMFIAIYGAGCSTTSYFLLKNHHFDTSETQGKAYKFKASVVGYQDVTAVVTDMGFGGTEPVEGDTEIVKNENIDGLGSEGLDPLSLLFDLALTKKLDISLDLAVGSQPSYVKLKYQFYGDKEDEENRFSISAIVGLGYISMDESDSDIGAVILNEFKVTGPVVRGAISAGVRVDGGLLVYWSNGYSRFFTKTDYDRDASDVGSFNIDGNQFSSMLGLNYVFEEKISLGVEYGYVLTSADFADNETFTSFAANIGYIF